MGQLLLREQTVVIGLLIFINQNGNIFESPQLCGLSLLNTSNYFLFSYFCGYTPAHEIPSFYIPFFWLYS